jgi:adenylate cyclase
MIAYRLGVVDREKRLLKRAFGFYLAPSLIDKLASGAAPALGGETREVTIFFSDVSGFSGLSEAASPREIVALMNEYFTLMSDAIEDAGGYVDKYVGDAVVALFGAPAPAQDHAVRAVTAALACRDRLAAFNAGRAAPIRHRIGINSGEALIGNVGSKRRFNFTAFGDNVNLAARIEELGSTFAAEILVSEQVRARAENGFVWREIDTVRVRGRERTVTLYEPLAKRGELAPDRQARANSYAAGLAAWRRGDFAAAAELFEVHAAADPPSARFLARCRAMIGSPPLGDWLVYHQQGR